MQVRWILFITMCNKAGLHYLPFIFEFLCYNPSWYTFLTNVRHTFIYSINFHIFFFSFLCINHLFCFFLFRAKLHVLDHLLPLFLEIILSTNQYGPNWYRLDFHFLLLVLYSANDYFSVNLGCVLIIFPVFHSSFPFILYSITLPLLGFLLLSFNSSLLIWRLLLCYPSSSSFKTPFISFFAVLFPSFLGLPNSLFTFINWHGCIL